MSEFYEGGSLFYHILKNY
jgi:serine/threonine protein kinase